MKYTDLTKRADYTDVLTHDFYDPHYVRAQDPKSLVQAGKYKQALTRLFKDIYAGKYGQGYNERGKDEPGKPVNIFVHNSGSSTPIRYTDWKKQLESAISTNDANKANALTDVSKYYVATDAPKSTYRDIAGIEDLRDDDIKALYSKDPRLNRILRMVAKARNITRQEAMNQAGLEAATKSTLNDYIEVARKREEISSKLHDEEDKAYNDFFDAYDKAYPDGNGPDISSKLPPDLEVKKQQHLAAVKRRESAEAPYWKQEDDIAKLEAPFVKAHRRLMHQLAKHRASLYSQAL